MRDGPPRILLIRRDNIGDLVCTTPLISALRQHFPKAHIAVYVNSYHRAVLDGNPDIDAVHAYTKRKHIQGVFRPIQYYWERARQIWSLRTFKFDDVIIAEPSYVQRLVRAARALGSRRLIGFAKADGRGTFLDVAVPRGSPEEIAQRHEVEDVFRLGSAFGINGPPPAVRVYARLTESRSTAEPVWGVHLSARKPSQRWPAERFVELIARLHRLTGAKVRLFWAPGDAEDARHPGDNDKAEVVLSALTDTPVTPCPTSELRTLIDGLAQCDFVLCSDGGAMHLAAGLGKPIVCLFGRSNATRWHPWGVPFRLLQPDSQDVNDLSVDEVLQACSDLQQLHAAPELPPAALRV